MCQGLLPSRRHIEKREDPGDEVAVIVQDKLAHTEGKNSKATSRLP